MNFLKSVAVCVVAGVVVQCIVDPSARVGLKIFLSDVLLRKKV